jgi:predicted porin
MKKSLTALAVLACAQAHAQSSVAVYGIVDAAVQHGSGSIAKRTQLGSGGIATSRLGFRGIEDLGGGMHAAFNLEAQLAADSGVGTGTNTNNQLSGEAPAAAGGQGLTFNRRSVVSLGGKWGALTLGHDYHTVFWNLVQADPFSVNGVGTTQQFFSRIRGTGLAAGALTGAAAPLSSRVSNAISYSYGFAPGATTLSPRPGVFAHAMYWLGENASNAGATKDDGKGGGFRVGFNGGNWQVALGHMTAEYAAPAVAPAPGAVANGDVRITSLLGVYDFKVARLSALVDRDRFGARTANGFTLGVTAPVGTGQIRASYSGYKSDATGNPSSRKLALGYVHNFSKRTAVYVTGARVRNSGGAAQALNGAVTAANASSTGYDLGLRHSF